MPLYDYQCLSCETVFEELRSIEEEESPSCPSCSSTNTQRKICSPYIVRDGTLFNRRRIPTQFKEGVLDRIKSKYPTAKKYFRD